MRRSGRNNRGGRPASSSARGEQQQGDANNNNMPPGGLSPQLLPAASRPMSLGGGRSNSSNAAAATAAANLNNISLNSGSSSGAIPRSNMVLLSGLNLSTVLNESTLSEGGDDLDTSHNILTAATVSSSGGAAVAPTRPRRLWKVQDHALPTLPPFWSAHPQSSCAISDASPSVVAVRIAECLRRRSIAAEYDEDAATVSCLTIDRCAFMIHLWRPSKSATSVFDEESASLASSGAASSSNRNIVVVECIRTRGPNQTYHWTVQAILWAAQGLDNGDDRRQPHQASPIEYPRWPGTSVSSLLETTVTSSSTTNSMEALEHAMELIRKDRTGAQCLGMQSLVSLTDVYCVGLDAALTAAVALLGRPAQAAMILGQNNKNNANSSVDSQEELPVWCLEGQQWLYGLVVDRQIPVREQQLHPQPQSSPTSSGRTSSQQQQQHPPPASSPGGESSSSYCVGNPLSSFLARGGADASSEYPADESFGGANARAADDQHAGTLRSLALRVLTNALTLLAEHQVALLESILLSSSNTPSRITTTSNSSSPTSMSWTNSAVIQALTDDLQGASRPPAVAVGGRLASAHEACMAVACLGVLGMHSAGARRRIMANESTLTLLERARQVGRSTHEMLYQQASRVYEQLTETERSC